MDLAKDGLLASCTELAIWIPGRVAAAVVRDPELSQHLLDSVLKNGLMPSSIGPSDAAKMWGSVYLQCSQQVMIVYLILECT